MLYARIKSNELKQIDKQLLKTHCTNVAKTLREQCVPLGLANTGYLIGLLHDMGKASGQWQIYLTESFQGKNPATVPHAIIGAQYIYKKHRCKTRNDVAEWTLLEIVALVILSHHTGLKDCMSLKQEEGKRNQFITLIEHEDENFQDAKETFFSQIIAEKDIDALYEKAKQEFREFCNNFNKIAVLHDNKQAYSILQGKWGMMARGLYSMLVYADWQDASLFEIDEPIAKATVDWQGMQNTFEAYINQLTENAEKTKINQLRSELSKQCKDFAQKPAGVYQLCLPTGAGKTLSSLRYALHKNGRKKIIYVIPYLSVIEQNAAVVKKVLGKQYEKQVLEFHSNVIREQGDSLNEKLYSEQWDYPIIMTTMVQFLNTLFAKKAASARRFSCFQDAVIIFDEIQALPLRCTHLFNLAVRFLKDYCNTTIVLCSATQPGLEEQKIPLPLSEPAQMVTGYEKLFEAFCRTKIHLALTRGAGHNLTETVQFLNERYAEYQNVLMICNTKKSALQVYQAIKEKTKATNIFYLSTQMCAHHRRIILYLVKRCLRAKQPVICISTQLIEAGVDISFRCVIRSLAGLDSIAQAAGRCNRSNEYGQGDVYVIDLAMENLKSLAEIKTAQKAAKNVFDNMAITDYLAPQTIAEYYQSYYNETLGNTASEQKNGIAKNTEENEGERRSNVSKLDYELPKIEGKSGLSIFQLLTTNEIIYKRRVEQPLPFGQSFETAYKHFCVIDNDTSSTIVPFGRKGQALIEQLANQYLPWAQKKKLLRQAQQFTVNIYDDKWRRLSADHLIRSIDVGHNLWQLEQCAYDNYIGIKEGVEMSIDDLVF